MEAGLQSFGSYFLMIFDGWMQGSIQWMQGSISELHSLESLAFPLPCSGIAHALPSVMEAHMQTVNIRTDYSIDIPNYGERLDIDNLIAIVKRSGSHFFDADSMRFFRSRVDDYTFTGPDGWYFVTSEKHVSHFAGINEPRKYTVRRLSISPDGDGLRLYELFGFQAFTTLNRARTAARNAAKSGTVTCSDCRLTLSYDAVCPECTARRERIEARQQTEAVR